MKQEYPARVWEVTRTIEVERLGQWEELQLWSSRQATMEDHKRRRETNERTKAESQ
jgi:hypothetical protein